jgi:RNA polymerase sigma factor (sigma-70 family)
MRIDWEEDVDERLAQRMQRGEDLAFATLTTRYWSLVHRICSNLLPSAAEAREATETIFLAMLPTPGSTSPASDASFRTALLQTALREALARRRAASGRGQNRLEAFLPRFDREGRLAWEGPGGSVAGFAFSSPDLRERIRRALRGLHELDHAAFVLHEVEGLDADDAGAVLGIPAESVRRRTHHASLMLTGFFGSAFDAPTASSSLAH